LTANAGCRLAASDISTQDTSADIAMEITNYTTMKCASSDTEPSGSSTPDGFLCSENLQHQYLSKQCSQQLTGLILNGKRSAGAGKLNYYAHLFNSEYTENNEHG